MRTRVIYRVERLRHFTAHGAIQRGRGLACLLLFAPSAMYWDYGVHIDLS